MSGQDCFSVALTVLRVAFDELQVDSIIFERMTGERSACGWAPRRRVDAGIYFWGCMPPPEHTCVSMTCPTPWVFQVESRADEYAAAPQTALFYDTSSK